MPKISIIIPAFNEQENISRTVNSICQFLRDNTIAGEIIVSDDGSSDNTASIVEKISLSQRNIKLINNSHQGKARAIKSGIDAAQADYVLLMDADGATNIGELNKLMTALKRNAADIAIGSREGSSAKRLNEPYYRHFMGRVFNKLIKIMVGLRFEDTQCGFKLFKSAAVKALSEKSTIMNREIDNLRRPLVTAFDVEMLILAEVFGFKVVEVPIVWQYIRTKNVNALNDSLSMFIEVLKIRINLMSGRYRILKSSEPDRN